MTKRALGKLTVDLLLCAALLTACDCAAAKKKVAVKPDAGAGPSRSAQQDSAQAAAQTRQAQQAKPEDLARSERIGSLSPASQLMVAACDNYLSINPESQKAADVLVIKASLFYNNKLFDDARASYKAVIDRFPKDPHSVESIRMIAQSYYEEKKFDDAQVWYRKLKDNAVEGTDKQEAVARIAESIFKLGESYEASGRLKDAATEYERVALEFPDAKIAEVSLFNAGLAYEKLSEWSQAILMYQKLVQKYIASKLLAKAHFRTAKSYEKLLQWNNAGETYLRVVANFPQSDLASVSLYNAGFCFENAGKLPVAAATFEKMAQLYPQSEDAADVLFRAGEIYGKIKDWAGVTRVNQEFTRRFGNDANRVIQAQCMVGVALYMQNKQAEALDQLNKAIMTFGKLKDPSTTNKYYAAKAEFTIGEITHEAMNAVTLTLPHEIYKKQMKSKSDLLDNVIASYSRVIKYQISEWTTRSIFSIGKAYEDFALAIFKQQRPPSMSMEERIALELGIAQAMEEYFVNKAAHYHEENVKLGIKEKIEDKYVLDSRQKLTSLPYLAGENYLTLVDIAQAATAGAQKLEAFALVAKKLETLQKIGPFQERAIALFLKCLENGSRYQQTDEFYAKASSLVTKTSFTVGQTYADIAATAREAPIPAAFDPYEAFVYKTKLLKQIEAYEDKSQENFLRTVKIAEAYKIDDDFVKQTRGALPKLLFMRGRCYDVLCAAAFADPPFPKNSSDAEKEEYRARFEEIGLQFQENAFDAYKAVLSYAKQNYAIGDYVTHAYVRMFQKYPKDYGVKSEKIDTRVVTSGPEWKCSIDTATNWFGLEFNDTAWKQVHKMKQQPAAALSGFPDKVPSAMWFGDNVPTSPQYVPAQHLAFRRVFYNYDALREARLWLLGIDEYAVYFNEKPLLPEAGDTLDWTKAKTWNLMGRMREGKNVLAVYVKNNIRMGYGLMPQLSYTVSANEFLPQPPQAASPLDPKQVAEGVYQFPAITNFPLPSAAVPSAAPQAKKPAK
jgi:tetratricopeptide (TPR) repeat protein